MMRVILPGMAAMILGGATLAFAADNSCGGCCAAATATSAKAAATTQPATKPTTRPSAPINKMCPVMGEDIDPKVTTEYNGKTIGFCCDSCIPKFKADPEKYMKKINEGKK